MVDQRIDGRVAGKVAFISGAARGQGRSHCLRLAEEGAAIIAVDACEDFETVPYPMASEDDLAETVRLVEKSGGRILARKADVRDRAALAACVEEGVAEFGPVDVVSANAAILNPARYDQISDQAWHEVLDVNVVGAYNTCAVALPSMLAAGKGGSIVLTSSCSGARGTLNLGHYAAAKHGVIGLMRSLAKELAEHSIRVNAVLPTIVNTDMGLNDAVLALFRPDLEAPTLEDAIPGFYKQNLLPITWIEAIDVSNALLFLASDEARYITSVVLPVDAGALETSG